jgi:hypothetical protein
MGVIDPPIHAAFSWLMSTIAVDHCALMGWKTDWLVSATVSVSNVSIGFSNIQF